MAPRRSGPHQTCTRQIRIGQIGPKHFRLGEEGLSQIGAGEDRAFELCAAEIRVRQRNAFQIAMAEIGTAAGFFAGYHQPLAVQVQSAFQTSARAQARLGQGHGLQHIQMFTSVQ